MATGSKWELKEIHGPGRQPIRQKDCSVGAGGVALSLPGSQDRPGATEALQTPGGPCGSSLPPIKDRRLPCWQLGGVRPQAGEKAPRTGLQLTS